MDAELDELRSISTDNGTYLLELEARERARTGISTLRVEFNRVHGFFIEVSRAQSEKVPEDYRRRQTLKNAERYITPELKVWEDKVLSAQDRSLAREKWLFEQLLEQLAAKRDGPGGLRKRLCGARHTRRARTSRPITRVGSATTTRAGSN